MELSQWWILPVAVLAAALVYAKRGRRPAPQRPVAHGHRLTHLPEYQRALSRHRRTLVAALVLSSLVLGASAFAAARPGHRTTEQPEKRNRDIVLCLDVSGSMTSTDAALAGVFQQLAREFDGERIGMVIFDSSSVQLFPLTDDYDYAAEQLAEAQAALDSGAGAFFDGTWNRGGSSLIGDGLASCVQSFPDLPRPDGGERSRSVILATDNFLSGEPIFTLQQASELARSKNVIVHALNPGDLDYGGDPDQPGAQLRAAAESTGGAYFTPDNAGAVAGIVAKVEQTEASGYLQAPQAVVSDAPAWPLGIALLAGLGLLVLGWRSQL